ncbi:MAG: lipoate--protein ligase family protein [Acidobacteria bacterium]|nr:lipoate--protein ligase family protein [Acidobacteriota bacterium]
MIEPAGEGMLTVITAGDADPFEALMAEELLLETARRGEPALLVAWWPGPSVILGYGQPEDDADLALCRREGIPVLRRITGGTGVIHDRDLAVGLALPSAHLWSRSIPGLYGRFLDVLAPALGELGAAVARGKTGNSSVRKRSPVCFEDHLAETLLVNGRKAVGCAQARRKGSVLVHAAVLLDLDAGLYARIFGIGEERIRRAVGPALSGTAPGLAAARLAGAFAAALDLEARPAPLPVLPPSLAARRAEARWFPVRGGC